MLKLVIFDMDGVLIDSEPLHFEVEQKLFRDLGLTIPEAELHTFVGITSREMWTRIKHKYNLPHSIEELLAVEVASYERRLVEPGAAQPVLGVIDLIKELYHRDIKLAVASSAERTSVDIVLRLFELGDFFEVVVSGGDVPRSKPAPDIFLRAAELAGVQPSECIVIEDAQNGVAAARAAGMKCVGYSSSRSGKQDLSAATMVISDFAQISAQRLAILA